MNSINNISKTIFLDTNIFLHYQDIDQIDWSQILKANKVLIVIPPITIHEINKIKDTYPKSRVRNRAAASLKKLFSLFQNGTLAQLRANVEIQLEDREPTIDFNSYQLNRDVQDDHYLASIISYRNETPDADIIFVTADEGVILWGKATKQGITTFKLSDDLRLPEEPDPDQETIRQLKQDLLKYESKKPLLFLKFKDALQHATFVIPPPLISNQDEDQRELSEIKSKYPPKEQTSLSITLDDKKKSTKIEKEDSLSKKFIGINASMLESISLDEIRKYNKELEIFYQNYEQYLGDKLSYKNLKLLTIKLLISLFNDGTEPAEDIDIKMHFPDGSDLFTDESYPNFPILPKPPSPPKTMMQIAMEGFSLSRVPYLGRDFIPSIPTSKSPPPNVSSPNIKRTNSFDVEIHVQRLKHHLHEPFETLHIVFNSYETAKSFHVRYEIFTANIPEKTTGTLHVIVQNKI
jgi:predicted nucleic acid-binding protein